MTFSGTSEVPKYDNHRKKDRGQEAQIQAKTARITHLDAFLSGLASVSSLTAMNSSKSMLLEAYLRVCERYQGPSRHHHFLTRKIDFRNEFYTKTAVQHTIRLRNSQSNKRLLSAARLPRPPTVTLWLSHSETVSRPEKARRCTVGFGSCEGSGSAPYDNGGPCLL